MSDQQLTFRAQIFPDVPVIEVSFGEEVKFSANTNLNIPIYVRFKGGWPFKEPAPLGSIFEVSADNEPTYTVDKRNGKYTYYLYFLNPFGSNGPKPPPVGSGDMDIEPPTRSGVAPDGSIEEPTPDSEPDRPSPGAGVKGGN